MNEPTKPKHKIAAFDFDGTSMHGNSPVLLVRYLQKHGMLKFAVIMKILSWAAAYKLRLPQSEAWVRGLVFTAFEGRDKVWVDTFLRMFYDEVIEEQGRVRIQAKRAWEKYQEEGVEVVIVSASFGPIIRRAQEVHGFDTCLCTEMKVDAKGRYTRRVDGVCVEGFEKVNVLRAYANERYGEGNWEIVAAYGDHHSDEPMLRAAKEAYAVTPDNPLGRLARHEGWSVLNWKHADEDFEDYGDPKSYHFSSFF